MQPTGEHLVRLSQQLECRGAYVAAYMTLLAALAQVEDMADGDRIRAVSLPMLRSLQQALETDADARACWDMILAHLGTVETLHPPPAPAA